MAAEEAGGAVGGRTEDALKTLRETLRRLGEEIAARGAAVTETLSRTAEGVGSDLSARLGALEEGFGQHGRGAAALIADQSDEAQARLEGTGREVMLAIAGHVSRVGDTLHRSHAAFVETADSRARVVEEALGSRLAALQETIARGDILADRIAGSTQALGDTLGSRLAEVDRIIAVQGNALAESLAERARLAGETVGARLTEMETLSAQRAAEIDERFASLLGHVDTRLGARATALNEALQTQHVSHVDVDVVRGVSMM